MNCLFAGKPVGNRIPCHHEQVAKGKRYTFVPESRCETCPFRTGAGTPQQAPQVTECIHRSDTPKQIEANCGCQGVKTLPLYHCGLIDGHCAETVLDFERLKETMLRAGDKSTLASCSACPHRAAVGERPTNLHAITCFFNPTDSVRMRENYLRFKAALPIPLHTVELLFSGQTPVDDTSMVICGDRERHTCWQKERLLNIALQSLPEAVDAVAWIDADILFPDDAWPAKACDMLKDYHVGQLWALAEWLGPDDTATDVYDFDLQAGTKTFTSNAYKRHGRRKEYGHPGFAWAARREFLDAIGGFFQWEAAAGGSDTWMSRAFDGQADIPEWLAVTPRLEQRFLEWAAPVLDLTQGRVGYVAQTIRHLYHGSRANRRYGDRLQHRYGYDPFRDLTIDDSGLLAWTGANPELEAYARSYFPARKPDE